MRPGLVQAEAAQRFLLGNHTWSHPDMTTLSTDAQAAQMQDASNEQTSLVGFAPCFFRPPYGSFNATTVSPRPSPQHAVYNWSVDTEDWKANGSPDAFWVNRIITLAQAGASQTNPVILMHNQPGAMPATVAALRPIIDFYRDRGYAFVDLNGQTSERQIAGDWDGNRTETPGVVRGNTWFLRNSNTSGAADATFSYGDPTDFAVTGDWDGNGTATPGVVRGGAWYLRNSNSSGVADAAVLLRGVDGSARHGRLGRQRDGHPGRRAGQHLVPAQQQHQRRGGRDPHVRGSRGSRHRRRLGRQRDDDARCGQGKQLVPAQQQHQRTGGRDGELRG